MGSLQAPAYRLETGIRSDQYELRINSRPRIESYLRVSPPLEALQFLSDLTVISLFTQQNHLQRTIERRAVERHQYDAVSEQAGQRTGGPTKEEMVFRKEGGLRSACWCAAESGYGSRLSRFDPRMFV